MASSVMFLEKLAIHIPVGYVIKALWLSAPALIAIHRRPSAVEKILVPDAETLYKSPGTFFCLGPAAKAMSK